MKLEFPYQIVTFLDREPQAGEPVYYGDDGWFAQVALKRRFKLQGIDESQLVQLLQSTVTGDIPIKTGLLMKPERMHVRVIDIENQDEIRSLHRKLVTKLGDNVISRYPDREGINYYAHITAEYDGEFVIPVDNYADKEFELNNVWLLKDIEDENSRAYIKIK